MYVPYLWALYRFLSPCLWVSENKGNGVIQTGQQLSNNCSNTRLTVNRASCLTFTLMSIFVVGFFLSPQNYSIIKRFLDLCFHNDTTLFWWRNSLFIPFQKKHIQWLFPVFLRESYGLIPCTSTVPLRPYFGLRICFIHRREKEKNKCRKYNLTAAWVPPQH